VEADNEFECAAVLQQHTQDVKAVAWHPVEEVCARPMGAREREREAQTVVVYRMHPTL
jgi:hypothetical protein